MESEDSNYGEGGGGNGAATTTRTDSVAGGRMKQTERRGGDREGAGGDGVGVSEDPENRHEGAGVGMPVEVDGGDQRSEPDASSPPNEKLPPSEHGADPSGDVAGPNSNESGDLGIASDRLGVGGVVDASGVESESPSFLDRPVIDPSSLPDPAGAEVENETELTEPELEIPEVFEIDGVFVRMGDEEIEIPEVDVTVRDDGAFAEVVGAIDAVRVADVLQGVWVQADRSNDPDFAPGGYSVRLLGIDSESGTLMVVQQHGDAGVSSGTFPIELEHLELRILGPHDGDAFAADMPGIRALGGRYSRADADWPRETRVSFIGNDLMIEDKRYRRGSAEQFRAMQEGGSLGAMPDPSTARAPGDGRRTIDFFGIPAGSSRICFIIDRSPSMKSQWGQVIDQLRKTVQGFSSRTRFEIVFFGGTNQADVIDGEGWATGTPAARRRVLDALKGLEPRGSGTDPEAALQYAFGRLDPRPDLIVLITDGQMATAVPGRIRSLNNGSRPTRVNTIAIGTSVNETLLQQIARENDGTYRRLK